MDNSDSWCLHSRYLHGSLLDNHSFIAHICHSKSLSCRFSFVFTLLSLLIFAGPISHQLPLLFFYFLEIYKTSYKRVSLDATVRLIPCNLHVTYLNPKISLFTYKNKAVYIYLLQTPLGGSFVHWAAPFYIYI